MAISEKFVYDAGMAGILNQVIDLTPAVDSSIKFCLLQGGGTPSREHANLAAVLAAHPECDRTSYARQDMTGLSPSIVDIGEGLLQWRVTPPTFGSLEAGNTLERLLAFWDVDGNDANAIPICLNGFTAKATDGLVYPVQFSGAGLNEVTQFTLQT